MGFFIFEGKLKARQAIALNRVEEDGPFPSDVAKADDIELQEITKNAARSTKNLIAQLGGESSEDWPMCEHLGLDKQLRSIRGSLKVEKAKKVKLEQHIEQERHKLAALRDHPEHDNGIREDIRHRIAELNDDLSVRKKALIFLRADL